MTAAVGGRADRPIRVVAFGGGHGLSASLRALRHAATELELDLTAIVTVGDDGGSSGRLRVERDALLPPGDLRQALAALADEHPTTQLTATLMQHRFVAMPEPGAGHLPPVVRGPRLERRADRSKDTLAGHTVGNLLLLGLMEMLGDPVRALDHAAAMVGACGRVLPMALHAVGIEADVAGTDPARPGDTVTVRGQHSVAVADGRVEAVRLEPADPPACPQAVEAVLAADWLIFGPGSWYTSVLPHLLVPGLARAIVASPARRLVTLNLGTDKETHGLSAAGHLVTLQRYLPELRVDAVLADVKWAGEPEPVRAAAQRMGAELVLAPVAVDDGSPRHDPEALGVALVPVLGAAR
ncbi:gluconeogenesis factor YvcK family protein [Actinoplanes teichomyceticus]|uniref:Putative gluconeogenesis factor n=1 Tax=Actinoplanes teichomyceticus TaxID=1867 RepID=A0A561WJH5_ACTTI|nr:2-phospho-L-lactate transferase CofD family protein [Actinoplanes teichomyceticus]TWG23970.1 putative cofD-like protein [Actinoplanes teichomyceticus]GIF12012.1 putative gluconeogenesis factor [Actinoplanes teichomyceticus]